MSTMPAIDDFRQNLQAACEKDGITQRRLSEVSGVHYVTVHKILHGKLTNPSLSICERLAAAAGISLPRIFKTPVDTV